MQYKFYLFLILLYAPLAMAKYQVCSITINSDDEIKSFKKFLKPTDFDFVELTPSTKNHYSNNSYHWFNESCKQNHKCDILVISGHFGGTFFGETGYTLPTELLEEKSCQNSCPNILSQVKEIFLFGCNTLASKKKDHRSHQDYLKVLLDDGMAREYAERVVAARYSALETPFYARMNFIFSGSSTIYGFDQLSPLGENISQPLSSYFQSINKQFGNYANYLKTNGHKRKQNLELSAALSHTTLNQAQLSLKNEKPQQKRFFQNKCLLYNDQKIFRERVQALEDIFNTQKTGSAFFAIDHFLNNNTKKISEGIGRKIFRSIKTNSSFSNQFRSYYTSLNYLPYIQLVYLNVLKKFQWINSVDLKRKRKKAILEVIKTPSRESYTSVLLLIQNHQIQIDDFHFSKKDLPKNYIQNIYSLLIFEKLKIKNPNWQEDMFDLCEENLIKKTAICYQVLNTLAHTQPKLSIARQASQFLTSDDTVLVYYALRLLGQSPIIRYDTHKRISSFLTSNNSDLKTEALEALGFLRTSYSDIQNQIAEQLQTADKDSAYEDLIFWSLSRIDIKGEYAQKTIVNYAIQNQENPKLVKKAFQALENSSGFSDFTLSFFYNHLETGENLPFLYSLIESLSRNTKLRDLGIHYRFLKYQTEDSLEIKLEVLTRLGILTWLHPEVQINFLNYLRDEETSVRNLATNILRNITNLEERTLKELYKLYKEENIKEAEVFFRQD